MSLLICNKCFQLLTSFPSSNRKNNAFLDNLERRQQSGENLHHISPSLPDEKFFRHQVKKDTREYVTAYHGDDEEEYLNDALTDHDVYRGSPEGNG